MLDTHKKESMNNVISYVAPKNKTMAHSMRLNNRISCVVVISIFRFKTYWKRVFALMEIPTTKEILLFRLMLCAIILFFGATYDTTLFIHSLFEVSARQDRKSVADT